MTIENEFILASASRRRHALLKYIGIPFKAIPSRVVEAVQEGETPEEHVLRLSEEKAEEVAESYPDHWVIGADTIVLAEHMILGKPRNRNEAQRMLHTLQGKSHKVYTGLCVMNAAEKKMAKRIVKTRVHFKTLSDREIDWYMRTGEPFDKAGGYAIQGLGGLLIREIEGSYTNVVGLPASDLVDMLLELEAWDLYSQR